MFVLLTRISCYIHYIVCFDKAVYQHHFTALVLNQDDFVFPKDICLKKKKKRRYFWLSQLEGVGQLLASNG